MPATHPRCEVIVDALQLACRAPSLHNSQPWRWIATNNTVELFADPDRLVRSADSTGREALISCGAVLDHFRVAMSASGWEAAVQRFPDPADPLHLATIEFTPAAVSDQHRRRADAILLRRSDRLRVDVVADEFRSSVAEASDLVEALRVYDAEYHSELSWWTAGFVTHEGIPRSSLISAAESDRVDVGRTFPVVVQPERRTEVDHDQSKILAISTEEDSSRSVLHCGEVLSAVLLNAAAAGCPRAPSATSPRYRRVATSSPHSSRAAASPKHLCGWGSRRRWTPHLPRLRAARLNRYFNYAGGQSDGSEPNIRCRGRRRRLRGCG